MMGSERRVDNGSMSIRLAALLLLTTLSGVRAGEIEIADHACLAPAAVDRALREGRAVRLTEVVRRFEGEIVRAELCGGDDGGLVYRVTLLDSRGSVRRILLDARDGRVVYDGR